MKRRALWLATAAALGLLALSAIPAAGASSAVPTHRLVRSVAPRVSQLSPKPASVRRRSPLASSPLAAATPAPVTPPRLPQAPRVTRGVPAAVPSLTDIYHVAAQQILINQDRAGNGGLAPLAWSPCLATVALQNAQRIAAQGYLSHTNGPNLDLACSSSYTTGGENIAYRSAGIDDAAANTMFMNSAPHRANILNGAYRFVGAAWVVTPNGYGYIAVEFAG